MIPIITLTTTANVPMQISHLHDTIERDPVSGLSRSTMTTTFSTVDH